MLLIAQIKNVLRPVLAIESNTTASPEAHTALKPAERPPLTGELRQLIHALYRYPVCGHGAVVDYDVINLMGQ